MKGLNRTKLLFSQTLKQMAAEMPLKKITATSLCERCDVSRGTFYYHFLDIQELINWTYYVEVILPAREMIKKINVPLLEHGNGISLFIMSTIYKSKEFYSQAVRIQDQNNLPEYMLKENTENWYYLWKEMSAQKQISPAQESSVEYVLEYFGHAHHYALMHWISNGMTENPEKIAHIIDTASLKGWNSVCNEILNI